MKQCKTYRCDRVRRMMLILLSVLFIGCLAAFAFGGVFAEQKQTNASAFTSIRNAEIIENYTAPEHIGNYKGTFIKAPENGESVIELSHELDLRAFTKDDILLKFIPITTHPIEALEDLQIDQLKLRLTDVEDEKIYVEIGVIANEVDEWPFASYLKAAGNGQVPMGYTKGGANYHERYGMSVRTNFYGRAREGISIEKDINALSIMYDYKTSQVHASEPDNPGDGMAADLTDSEVMRGEWPGFKSGRVRMTLTADSTTFNNKNSGYLILQVGAQVFSGEEQTDTAAPRMEVDTLGYSENALPQGRAFFRYPVFQATAYDFEDTSFGIAPGEKSVDVTVKRMASDENIPIRDGGFIPQEVGRYRIRYTAVDYSGNETVKDLYVTVNDVFYRLEHEFTREIADTVDVGSYISIPESNVTNACGEYTLAYSVFETVSKDEVSVINGRFVVLQPGIYCLRVTVKDFLSEEKFDYYFETEASETPVIPDEVFVPNALIAGKETSFPDFEAYDYYSFSGTRAEAEKRIDICTADGEVIESVLPGQTFVPDAAKYGDFVTVKYIASSILYGGEKVIQKDNVKVIDRSEELRLGDYFTRAEIDRTEYNYGQNSQNVTFFFDSENARLDFANPLSARDFELQFRVPATENNFGWAEIVLTDSYYADREIIFRIIKGEQNGTTSLMTVNGGEQIEISGSFFDNLRTNMMLLINREGIVTDASGLEVARVETYLSGVEFDGFTDGLCYLSVRFGDVTGASAFSVVKINNQWFTSGTADLTNPVIAFKEDLTIEQNVGEVYIPGAVAADVLYGVVRVNVSVVSPTGTQIYSGMLPEEGLTFAAGIPGMYEVTYSATDDNLANETRSRNSIYVYQDVAIGLGIDGEMPAEWNHGTELVLPKAVFTGNADDVYLSIYVVCSGGEIVDVTQTMSFVPQDAGKYYVYYFAVNDVTGSYNYDLLSFAITVV
ncbi:MAG TPA: hypothetical protein H9708_00905 [Candidatus Borkfalkia stercoripullorum]|nr:hypothetical protein [Candidatus Borkfalkia stercoripullorum]